MCWINREVYMSVIGVEGEMERMREGFCRRNFLLRMKEHLFVLLTHTMLFSLCPTWEIDTNVHHHWKKQPKVRRFFKKFIKKFGKLEYILRWKFFYPPKNLLENHFRPKNIIIHKLVGRFSGSISKTLILFFFADLSCMYTCIFFINSTYITCIHLYSSRTDRVIMLMWL